jgi:hypothetical protein
MIEQAAALLAAKSFLRAPRHIKVFGLVAQALQVLALGFEQLRAAVLLNLVELERGRLGGLDFARRRCYAPGRSDSGSACVRSHRLCRQLLPDRSQSSARGLRVDQPALQLQIGQPLGLSCRGTSAAPWSASLSNLLNSLRR